MLSLQGRVVINKLNHQIKIVNIGPSSKLSSIDSMSEELKTFELGNVDFCQVDPNERVYVGNMLAQEYIKQNKHDQNQYLSYEKLKECLSKVADFALVNRLSVQCPLIGTGLAGGDWNLISEMPIKYICSKKIHCHVVKLDK